MHTRTLKKLALALTFWLALHTASLRAQVLGPYTNTNNPTTATFEFDANGVLWETGTGPSTLTLSGAGTRMFWFPAKAAFRAGTVSAYASNDWDIENIGPYSVAFGNSTLASGSASTASGWYSSATGNMSTASGYCTQATSQAATAFGNQTYATSQQATAFGMYTAATGADSTASGYRTRASGFAAIAAGRGSNASGSFSTASGYNTTASAWGDFVLGLYNVGNGNPTAWVATDPLFEIGDGTYTTHSDALLVLKNGNTTLYGKNNLMPNQGNGATLGPTSILTEGLADSRYVKVGSWSTSFALFSASATGTDSVAMGYNASASGQYSLAFGNNASATAPNAIAFGQWSQAIGGGSTAWGGGTASGYFSTAWGGGTASGYFSTASGYTQASALRSFVIGALNVGTPEGGGGTGSCSANTWVPTDPLFEIGNGGGGYDNYSNPALEGPSDALVVFKDGDVQAQGTIRCSAGGDLSMGSFTAGANPALGQP